MNLSELRSEAWLRLLAAARRRLESNGGTMDGTISLAAPTDEERRVIIGITGSHRSARADRIRVSLQAIDTFLDTGYGCGLKAALSYLDGRPVRDRRAEHARESAEREMALELLGTCHHATTTWYQTWLGQITSDGTVTRLIRRGTGELRAAVAILDRLPADELPLPVLAELVTGDTKALSSTPLATLVLRALACWHDLPQETAEEQRALWDASSVIVDDLASQVLVLNLPATGGTVAQWLTSAAAEGIPFRVTLHQLRHSSTWPVAAEIYVCENPAVLRAAATALGPNCAPLICTEGVPSVACRRLVAQAVQAGAHLHWRNDFDWPGLRMTAAAVDRFGAQPWQMAAGDYRRAVSRTGTLLRGPIAPSPWDPELAVAMTETGNALMEERLLPQLLVDLEGRTGLRNSAAHGRHEREQRHSTW